MWFTARKPMKTKLTAHESLPRKDLAKRMGEVKIATPRKIRKVNCQLK
jgi:hypothetical protein